MRSAASIKDRLKNRSKETGRRAVFYVSKSFGN